MDELVKALKNNFEGHEPLRQTLLNRAPKYGNDDPEADDIAREVNQFLTEDGLHARLAGHRQALPRRLPLLELLDPLRRRPPRPPRTAGQRGRYLVQRHLPGHRRRPQRARRPWSRVGPYVGLETVPNGASHTITFNPA